MEFSVEVPVDPEGFLRRECPHCETEFKWFHGATDETPVGWENPDAYFCPYCGRSAKTDGWWTKDQLEYVRQITMTHVGDMVDEKFDDLARTINRQGGVIKIEVSRRSAGVAPPAPLAEPNDMVAVASPCHPFEPIKVLDGYKSPLHCLVCGSQFTV